jgi:parvulin-like peptidyl-prolyl isomerase
MPLGRLSLSLLALALSCGGPEPAARNNDPLLAKVGGAPITEGEFRRLLANLPEWTASQARGGALVREYLQTLIDRALILQEARARGLEQGEKIRRDTAQSLRQRLVEEVEKREFRSRVSVGEEEVERAFVAQHWNRKLKIAHILVSSRARAEAALAALQAGRSFGEVAREFSENSRTAPHGGERPFYYSRNNAHPAVRDALFRLGVGEVSGIIPIPQGFEIFKVLDEALLPYEKIAPQIYEELLASRTDEARRAFADSLALQLGLQPVREGLGTLMRVLRDAQQQGASFLGPGTANVAIYTYAGGQILLGEAVEQSQFIRQARAVADSLRVDYYLQRDVVVPHLLRWWAYQRGIDREPAIIDWLERRTEDALVLEMRRLEGTQRAAVTDQEAQEFYQAHQDRYRTSSQVEVVEILVASQTEAEGLLAGVRADRQRAHPLVRRIRAIQQGLAQGEEAAEQLQALRALGDGPEVYAWLRERLADPGASAQLIAEIARARSPEDLVEQFIMRHLAATRSLRPESSQAEGCYRLFWYDQGRFGPLVKEAMEAEPGALIGPLENDAHYSVAKVIDQRPAEVLPFAQVEKRIKAALREEKERQLFAGWLAALRRDHRDEVVFFDEQIEALGRQLQAETQDASAAPSPR